MHREYHPADMHHLRAHAFDERGRHEHGFAEHRSLFLLTAVLGLLIGGELLFGAVGWESWRAPWGISLVFIAAVIGGVRIVYAAIDALAHGRIGADIALAQACLAALVIGQPFVAAEVVFIALVGLFVPALRWLYDYAWFVGFGTSAGIYLLLMQGLAAQNTSRSPMQNIENA